MSNTMTQGDAVFQAVCNVVGRPDHNKVELSKEQLKQVHSEVLAMFKSGQTSHRGNPTDEELAKYVPGLVNNWLRKDKRLNGGVKYETKRPGSRTGSGDEQLKAMKQLLSITTDPDARSAIELEMKNRLEVIKPKPTVDVSKLPESLRHLVR